MQTVPQTIHTHHDFSFVSSHCCSKPLIWFKLYRFFGSINSYFPVVWQEWWMINSLSSMAANENYSNKFIHYIFFSLFLNLSKRLEEGQIFPRGRIILISKSKTLEEKKPMQSFYMCRHIIANVQQCIMFKSLNIRDGRKNMTEAIYRKLIPYSME